MSKYTGFNEFLTKDSFIREPVDRINRNMDEDLSNKIILTGGRNIGKTTVLLSKENVSLGNNIQCIYAAYSNNDMFSLTNEILEGNFAEHYYELIISNTLIYWTKKYYPFTYEKYLRKYDEIIHSRFKEKDNHIRNFRYKNLEKCANLKCGDFSFQIFNLIKDELEIKKLLLAIDRFDWLKQRTQEVIKPYFNLFDKTIITVDDVDALQTVNDDYSIVTCNYNLNSDFVKELIKRQINEYENNEVFPISVITDEMCERLIKLSNGNLNVIKNIINRLFIEYKWKIDGEKIDVDRYLNLFSEDENNKILQIRKIGVKPKFYL